MGKDPSFPFYASDWLGSNARAQMTLEQQAAYINLLARQWSDKTCSLPDDDEALARLSEMGEGWLPNGATLVRECFPKHPTLASRIANPKLLKLRAERDVWIEKSRKGGRKSGQARRLKSKTRAKGGTTTVPTKREPNGNSPSPSPSPSPKKKETPLPPFDEIDFPAGLDTPEVRQAIVEWLEHKRIRQETYKRPASQLKKLLRQDWCVSPEAFVAAVDNSIAQNYAGCFPKRGRQNAKGSSSASKYDPQRPVTPL